LPTYTPPFPGHRAYMHAQKQRFVGFLLEVWQCRWTEWPFSRTVSQST